MSSYYEKIGGNVRCIDEEIPFEVPDNWEWVRLGNAIELYSGRDLLPQSYNDNNEGIPYVTGASNICEENIIVNRWTKNPVVLSTKGDLLITCKGTVGAMAFNTLGNVHIARQIMAIRALYVDIEYIRIFLLWYMPNLIQQAKSMIPGISRENILDAIIPLPPINEQYTIRNQLEIIDSLLSKYDKLEQETEKLDIQLPELLKKSILQSAIQGKLVAQNPDDGPASILLEKIRKEKEQLIKAGKLKRDKNESFIYKNTADNSYYESRNGKVLCIDEEIPFELPDNWAWCRLGSIAQHNTGKTLDKERNKGILRRYITTSNLYWGYFDLSETRQMPFKEEELERCTAQKGDLLICEGGEAGRSAIWQSENPICFQNHIHRVRPYANISSEYLLRFMEKINLSGEINIYRKGVGIKGLSGNALASIIIPLPPLNEQNCIIKKIAQLFAVLS
ncbi:MAG: restriction endonuclease subunit S [Bacteroidales bacterium]|jgi:type I restriction enzyme S subunit|nr:restriction endonuclease subunit S [Bacteroidales bacterium]